LNVIQKKVKLKLIFFLKKKTKNKKPKTEKKKKTILVVEREMAKRSWREKECVKI
jgi:hypothetical protein